MIKFNYNMSLNGEENFMQRHEDLVLFWIGTLSFISGYANVYGIILIGLTLTHFTGDISKAAIHMINHVPIDDQIIKIFLGLLLFLVGNIFSGAIIGERAFNIRKRYGLIFFGIGFAIFFSYIFFKDNNNFAYMLCLTTGIQNGLFMTYKGILIRTSHLTGSISDLGVYIGYKLRGIKVDNIKIFYYITTIIAFFCGGIVATYLYNIFQNDALILIPLLYFLIGASYFQLRRDFQDNK